MISMALASRLYLYVNEKGLGTVVAAPIDVVLSDRDVVQPDVLFVSSQRSPESSRVRTFAARRTWWWRFSPLQQQSANRTVKLGLYAQHGVIEYWMVDPDAKTVTRSVAGGGRVRGRR